ncbi:MAG: hypothetical protein P8Y85_10610 [Nitrospirota bacterium]|jgi:hypothetical protein
MERKIEKREVRGRGLKGSAREEACRYFLDRISACEHALPLVPRFKDLVCRGASEKCPVYQLKSGVPYGPGDSRPYEEDGRRVGSLCLA